MDRGYIKLWRKSLDSGLMQNPKLWFFWCWCLMKATHKPIKQAVGFQVVPLQPGQFVFGLKQASIETRFSIQTIRTCLKNLKNMENLTIQTTNHFSIISITNWDIYQCSESEIDKQSNKQVTHNQHTPNNKQEQKHINTKEEKKKTLAPTDFSNRSEPPHRRIILDHADWTYHGILDSDIEAWATAYPACDIGAELQKSIEYIKANPHKAKKNWYRYITGWLGRSQERGGTNGYRKATSVTGSKPQWLIDLEEQERREALDPR